MNILIVHQNFPGQFPAIADALARRGDRVVALGGPTARPRKGVEFRRWENKRSTTQGIYPFATRAEADMIRAEAAAKAALALKGEGFMPDVIIGHAGWGEQLHLRDVWPEAKLILFGEYFYHATGADVGFDPEFGSLGFETAMRTNGKNAVLTLLYAMADRIVSPTPFQASLIPKDFQHKLTILHEGVQIASTERRAGATLTLPDGRVIDGKKPVVTYVSRTFEGLRGFHIFMRSLPSILAAVPDAEIVVIGSDDGHPYGGARPDKQSWQTALLAELGNRLDLSRVHFLGRVAHPIMIDALSISWAHIYYTYPFVLSWSLTEAMACECAIAASDTAPVRDAITHGVDGMLGDFFDVEGLATTVITMLREPERFRAMRKAARETAMARFDRDSIGVPGWLKIVDEVAAEA